jgi:DNA-binding transcriptional ArsR family regulator
MDESNDGDLADRIICRVGILLAHLRATVPMSETKNMQGSVYAYTFALIEDPTRAITQLRNLARGHALSKGRTYFTMDNIPIVIHTAISTASMSRVRIFELLIAREGKLTTTEIVNYLNTSPPTARDTMAELKAAELVEMRELNPGEYNSLKEIRLKDTFGWFLTDQFKEPKEKVLEDESILWKEKCTPERGTVEERPMSLIAYDYTVRTRITSLPMPVSITTSSPLLGRQISFHQNITQKTTENHKLEEPLVLARSSPSNRSFKGLEQGCSSLR